MKLKWPDIHVSEHNTNICGTHDKAFVQKSIIEKSNSLTWLFQVASASTAAASTTTAAAAAVATTAAAAAGHSQLFRYLQQQADLQILIF